MSEKKRGGTDITREASEQRRRRHEDARSPAGEAGSPPLAGAETQRGEHETTSRPRGHTEDPDRTL